MVLGIYYLTYGPTGEELETADKPKFTFRTAQEAELAYEDRRARLQDLAIYRPSSGEHITTTVGRILFNDRIERALAEALGDKFDSASTSSSTRRSPSGRSARWSSTLVALHGAPSVALVLDAFKELGFHYSAWPGSASRRTTW